MNATAKGDAFEDEVREWIESYIAQNGGIHFMADTFECLPKHRIYSHEREGDITFDLVVEARFSGESECHNIIAVECKDKSRPLEVGDLQKFLDDTRQIKGRHVKPLLVSRSGLQEGALAYARNNGIAVVRWHDRAECEWVLRSHPDVTWRAEREDSHVLSGLTNPTPLSEVFARFFLAGDLLTTSDEAFWAALMDEVAPGASKRREPPRTTALLDVPFVTDDGFEAIARKALTRIGYTGGATDLGALSCLLGEDIGLVLIEHEGPFREGDNRTLGRALFDAAELHLYQTATAYPARRRFAWAHELAHFLLGHGSLLMQELLRFKEGEDVPDPTVAHRTIRRLEVQANRLASSLLMPRDWLVPEVMATLDELGVRNRGFGAIYLDGQPCNRIIFMAVMSRMMSRYNVSLQSARIRLKQIGLLKEVSDAQRVSDLLARGPGRRS